MPRVYVGWDPVDIDAYTVCIRSLRAHSKADIQIIPIKEWEMRKKGLFWRPYFVDATGQKIDAVDGKPFSTGFSFTRFCSLLMEDEIGLFIDADTMFRADVEELFDLWDYKYKLMCVHHEHVPTEEIKMIGYAQTQYWRKNWSSVFLFAGMSRLTKYMLNKWPGSHLHQFRWLKDEEIGELPEEWNWLEGWSSEEIDPKLVHYTRGTPDMEGYEDSAYAEEWRSYLS